MDPPTHLGDDVDEGVGESSESFDSVNGCGRSDKRDRGEAVLISAISTVR